jgi:hypothetical protein
LSKWWAPDSILGDRTTLTPYGKWEQQAGLPLRDKSLGKRHSG